jgi:hypothetical protein
MSWSFYIYRAADGTPPVIKWPRMLSESVGTPEEVRSIFEEMLPAVEWIKIEKDSSFGSAGDLRYQPGGFYIHLHNDEAGQVCLISMGNGASPHTLSTLMSRLGLNHCCTEFGDFREPHRCNDEWEIIK